MKLYVRPMFDRTPLVKITKLKLIELRTSLKEHAVTTVVSTNISRVVP